MPKRTRLGSVVWEYFIQKDTDITLAICQICQAEVRRGKPGSTSKDLSTKGMWCYSFHIFFIIIIVYCCKIYQQRSIVCTVRFFSFLLNFSIWNVYFILIIQLQTKFVSWLLFAAYPTKMELILKFLNDLFLFYILLFYVACCSSISR